ncbi:hypothetical protein GPECTOR_59g633 [Gonium pectorale]|uniref:Uncharacterized protein n=1 Tax=Gonium pectorale TaxID=33097 RepID=A0A150G671_GONPE|nr:hypothetical protein GPECTOR_59g633 [Gonium pectorale]|eukprot:KXZ45025.1 hypothetical protein GPECTOR_59g633 [Gonium pectorale]
MALPRWAVFLGVASIPVATYSWILMARPNLYEQIQDEIKRQEERDRAAGKLPARA